MKQRKKWVHCRTPEEIEAEKSRRISLRKKYYWQQKQKLLAAPVPHSELKPMALHTVEASNEYHTGRAVLARRDGFWRWQECSPCLAFLAKLQPLDAKVELIKRGFDWRTTPPLDMLSSHQ